MKAFKEYQHLEGEKYTDRAKTEIGSRFWNEGKFESFVKPFLPEDCSELTFIDVGCNKGVFLKEAENMGFGRVVGVDSDKLAVESGRSWADKHGKSYKILLHDMENVLSELPMADYTVMANTHYYFTINDWLDYLDRLKSKTMYCIIITAQKRKGNRCWARADVESIRRYFSDWEEVGYEEGPPLEGDPHPRKLWGLCFKSPLIDREPIDKLDSGNHVQDEFYGELDEGKHYTETKYYKILRPYRLKDPHNWTEEQLHTWFEGRVSVYMDLKENGLKSPIIINGDNLILDGNHRCSMLSHLGNRTVLIRRTA